MRTNRVRVGIQGLGGNSALRVSLYVPEIKKRKKEGLSNFHVASHSIMASCEVHIFSDNKRKKRYSPRVTVNRVARLHRFQVVDIPVRLFSHQGSCTAQASRQNGLADIGIRSKDLVGLECPSGMEWHGHEKKKKGVKKRVGRKKESKQTSVEGSYTPVVRPTAPVGLVRRAAEPPLLSEKARNR